MSCWPVSGLDLCRWEKTCAVIDFAPVRDWSMVAWSKTVRLVFFFFFLGASRDSHEHSFADFCQNLGASGAYFR